MYYNLINSPIGKILICTDEQSLIELRIFSILPSLPKNWARPSKKPLLKLIEDELNQYFSGQRKSFAFSLKFNGTPFQEKVWQELLKIPYGQTRTYKDIACKINNPKAVRAVGTAIGRNPINILIPCHRVIKSNGQIGEFQAGANIKKALLEIEKTHK